MAQAGVQAGTLVGQGQRAVRVGEVVEEDPASEGQPHGAQAGGRQTGALQSVELSDFLELGAGGDFLPPLTDKVSRLFTSIWDRKINFSFVALVIPPASLLTLLGSMGSCMNLQPGHLTLGLELIASCSAGWSGICTAAGTFRQIQWKEFGAFLGEHFFSSIS